MILVKYCFLFVKMQFEELKSDTCKSLVWIFLQFFITPFFSDSVRLISAATQRKEVVKNKHPVNFFQTQLQIR